MNGAMSSRDATLSRISVLDPSVKRKKALPRRKGAPINIVSIAIDSGSAACRKSCSYVRVTMFKASRKPLLGSIYAPLRAERRGERGGG